MYALALLIGIVAGLRTLTAPTAISWAAWSGRLALEGSWLASLAYSWTPWIFEDPPAAFIEDAIAIGGAWLIVQKLS